MSSSAAANEPTGAAAATKQPSSNKARSRFQAAARAVVTTGGKHYIIKEDPEEERRNPLVVSSTGQAMNMRRCHSAGEYSPSVKIPKRKKKSDDGKEEEEEEQDEEDKLADLARSSRNNRSALIGSRFSLPFHRAAAATSQHNVFSWPEVFVALKRKKKQETDAAMAAVEKAGGGGGGECVDIEDEFEEDDDISLSRRILRFILSWEFELFLLFLLACDVIFLIVELELSTRVVCHIKWDSSDTGVIATNTSLGNVNCTEAPGISFSCEHERKFQLPAAYAACPFHVTEELPHAIHLAEVVIGWFSRGIIIFFGLELLVMLLCAGPAIFWIHKLYLLDAVIILVSVLLEILAELLHIDHAGELVVLARVWRFARIVHGVGVSVHDVDEHEVNPEETDELLEEISPGPKKKKKYNNNQSSPEEEAEEAAAGGSGKIKNKTEDESEPSFEKSNQKAEEEEGKKKKKHEE